MTWKSYAVVSGATVLAGWLASSPPGDDARNNPGAQPERAAAVSAAATDIAEETARLEARLRHEATYREPQRNPFQFGAGRPDANSAAEVAPAPEERVEDAAPLPLPAPPIALSGIAEDHVDGRLQRTAVLSSPNGVLLVREGQQVLGRYRVERIERAAVELTDASNGSTLRLSLGR